MRPFIVNSMKSHHKLKQVKSELKKRPGVDSLKQWCAPRRWALQEHWPTDARCGALGAVVVGMH